MKVGLVAYGSVGGVKTFVNNLYRGMSKEAELTLITYNPTKKGKRLFDVLNYDRKILLNENMVNLDLLIYVGSVPHPSHLIAKMLGIPVVLCVNGFIYHEFLRGKIINAPSSILSVGLFDLSKFLRSVDLYVCPSETTCEATGINDYPHTVLPSFILDEDLEIYDSYRKVYKIRDNDRVVRIVTYTSYTSSPRLLNLDYIIKIFKELSKHSRKKLELVVVDPGTHSITTYFYDNINVKIVKPLSHKRFLELVASSHLYFDNCIDEEIRYSSLEALALGTPVAKLIHPTYMYRADHGKNYLLVAHSFKSLIEKLSHYVNDIDVLFDEYSRRSQFYIKHKRAWSIVKNPFMSVIKKLVV